VESTFGLPDLLLLVAFMAVPILLWRLSNRTRGVVRIGLRVIAVALLALLIWNTVVLFGQDLRSRVVLEPGTLGVAGSGTVGERCATPLPSERQNSSFSFYAIHFI
jgi:hypothetical protein